MIGSIVHRINQTDSSNNYAASQLLTKRLPEGAVFVADSQIDGRGQASNKWESEPNMNLTFSIILYPDFLEVSRQFELSKTISLGVADYLNGLTDNVSVKWPNDIYIGTGKVAGILIENSIRGDKISSSIIGIGLNINQIMFSADVPNPVSLSQATGKVYNLEECLNTLCLKIDARYHQLRNGKFGLIDEDYLNLLFRRGVWSMFSDEKGDFEGRIQGVDPQGQLLIETKSGRINKYQFKEVEFRL